MSQPSVDRIDPSRDYTPDNVQWIEFEQNRRRVSIFHPSHRKTVSEATDSILNILNPLKWTPRMKYHLLRKIGKDLMKQS